MLRHVALSPTVAAVVRTQICMSSTLAANRIADHLACRYRPYHHQQQQQQARVPSNASIRCFSRLARSGRRVHPSLARLRPLVNGEPIPFHMRDLVQTSSLHHGTSAAAADEQDQDPSTATRRYESDLIVVLDMDECLIHSKFLSTPAAAQVYAHQLRRQAGGSDGDGDTNSNTTLVDSFRVTLPDGDLVHVNVRPGLETFLRQVTAKYETHIFTAAMEVYAKPVLDRLDPSNKLAARWYREACRLCPEHGVYIKDLQNLPIRRFDRAVLVDNNPMSFLAQPSNGILVSNFYDSAADDTLPAVWDLLEELDQQSDVRPVLEERFRLKEALQAAKKTRA